MSDNLSEADLSLKGLWSVKKEKFSGVVEASTSLNYDAEQKTNLVSPSFKLSGTVGPVDFESVVTPENGGVKKETNLVWSIGDHKEFSFGLFFSGTNVWNPDTFSANKRVHLRTSYKNMVVSAGVEDWDVFNKDNRAPKVASVNTSYIHDLNNDVRLYGGLNFGVNVHPFRMQHGHLLAGFNYMHKHRLVVVAGGNFCDVLVSGDKSKNEEDNNEVCRLLYFFL